MGVAKHVTAKCSKKRFVNNSFAQYNPAQKMQLQRGLAKAFHLHFHITISPRKNQKKKKSSLFFQITNLQIYTQTSATKFTKNKKIRINKQGKSTRGELDDYMNSFKFCCSATLPSQATKQAYVGESNQITPITISKFLFACYQELSSMFASFSCKVETQAYRSKPEFEN